MKYEISLREIELRCVRFDPLISKIRFWNQSLDKRQSFDVISMIKSCQFSIEEILRILIFSAECSTNKTENLTNVVRQLAKSCKEVAERAYNNRHKFGDLRDVINSRIGKVRLDYESINKISYIDMGCIEIISSLLMYTRVCVGQQYVDDEEAESACESEWHRQKNEFHQLLLGYNGVINT